MASKKRVAAPQAFIVHLRTNGGSLLSWEIERTCSTLRFNGSEIAQFANPDLAMACFHITQIIARYNRDAQQHILETDKEFQHVEEKETHTETEDQNQDQ